MIRRFLFGFFCLTCFVSLPSSAAGQSSVPVTIAWDPNDDDPEGYAVFIGTQPGVYTEAVDVGRNISFTYVNGAVGRRYYFTVAAYKPKPRVGPKATPVSTVIEAPAEVTLEPPIVSGSTVTLRWHAKSGSEIIDYIVEAGRASGLSNVFRGSVGVITELTATVGPGAFFVRVIPRTTTHVGTPSNEVGFSTEPDAGGPGCTAPPPAPTGVSGAVRNGMASIWWTPAPGAIRYGVQAGTRSGLNDIFEGAIEHVPSLSSPVESGFHAYVRVYAINACGISAPSKEVVVR
jgi:hypothetical protein